MEGFDNLKAIQISIASPEQIRAWSHGVVKKPETINYRTHRPERDGLFCERIFGPTRDYECFCGKYKSIRYKGLICERCGVEITRASERRERMGHIELVTPVAHIWYSKGTPNYIAMLLDISTRDFEKVLYFNSYIVLDPGNLPLMMKQILSEKEYQDYRGKYGDMFKAGMGAEAIKFLLKNLDLPKLIDDLKRKLKQKSGSQKQNIMKRLEIAETFLHSKSKPAWMILDILPVIPPDLRPMVQLDGGRFATSDLNDLYRRVINRNNRLARLIKLNAPEIIIKNEKRMLQEAVNALIDNGRRGRPVTGPGNRPLKSLNDMLKGKQGRFRQNLLGKRVDYSGRSVIVVGPSLKMHQCGLPQRMALELFKPFIMHKLVDYGLAHNIKSAKRMIEREQDEVWSVLEEVVCDHPVILNRAPTLHRHGIQAFEPVLVEGKAIQIHPLVCAAFNADFDGDQMAVHVPLLLPAKTECRVLLLSTNNLLSASNGGAVASPSQDMAIGCFYLTMHTRSRRTKKVPVDDANDPAGSLVARVSREQLDTYLADNLYDKSKKQLLVKDEHPVTAEDIETLRKAGIKEVEIVDIPVMHGEEEVLFAYETAQIGVHDHVFLRRINPQSGKSETLNTTVGRVIFNQILPPEMGYMNSQIGKGDLMRIIERSVTVCGTARTAELLDRIKEMGFKFATKSGLSISMADLEIPSKKAEIIHNADKKVVQLIERAGKDADMDEVRQAIIDIWIGATDEVTDAMLQNFKTKNESGVFNSVYLMMISGARGNTDQTKQLAGMRGLMANPHGDIIPVPIKASFREGLSMTDYFISTYGARKGLVDTALRTADSGYLTRRLVDVAQDSIIFEHDCGTDEGLLVMPLREKRTPTNQLVDEIILSLRDRIWGRVAARDIRHPMTGEVLIKAGGEIDREQAKMVVDSECVVSVDELNEFAMIGEMVLHPRDKTVLCGPDMPVNDFLKKKFKDAEVDEVKVYPAVYLRSPIHCRSRLGVCQKCYGYDLSTNRLVDMGVAVGVIAAQSIGEPGTQLTMRTFHTGGVAVARKANIKARAEGELGFDELIWQLKVTRGKYVVDMGTTEEVVRESDMDRTTRKVALGGQLVIRGAKGKVDRYSLPVGAVLKVNEGEHVRQGTALADYNPNEVITAHSGTIEFHNIIVKDGLQVSKKASIRIKEGNKTLAEYDMPQRCVLKVEAGDVVVAGDVLGETAIEEKSAIAGRDGRVEFVDIKVKNQRVISELGMVYILPTEEADSHGHEVEMPQGIKHLAESIGPQEIPEGPVIRVKNGDQIKSGDEVATIYSELPGTVDYKGKKTIGINSFALKEYYMTGNMQIEMDEANKNLTFVSEVTGKVKIMSYRSSSNKTVDRRRIIVKDERVYVIPEGAQLKPDNVAVQAGDDVKEGQKITGPIPFVSEVDGTVELRKLTVTDAILLSDDDTTVADIKGRKLAEDVIDPETGEVLATREETIEADKADLLLSARDKVGKVLVYRPTPQECIVVKSAKGSKEYLIPEGATLKVQAGDVVSAGDQLIESFAPIEAETSGKVNFITGYNKHTGEDLIRKIIVYSGRDYFLPVGIPLCVKNGQEVAAGEPLTEPITYHDFTRVDRGIKFTRQEEVAKKYHINDETEVLVKDGSEVQPGHKLAVIRAPASGVVKVVKALTKSGKMRSVVERVIVLPGEAHQILDGAELTVKDGQAVKKGDILAKWGTGGKKTTDIIQGLPRVSELFEVRKPRRESVVAADYGQIQMAGNNISIVGEESHSVQYKAQYGSGNLIVQNGEIVKPGTRLTDGNLDPRKLAKVAGTDVVERYLIDEVQHVYKSQGVTINDRHVEVIVGNMMTKVQILKAGDTRFLPGETPPYFDFSDENARVVKAGGKPAQGVPKLQGITKASLTTDSFISAASFQETTRVLTKAAIKSRVDHLRGLKENIIIGKLIPAGTGLFTNKVRFRYADEKMVEEQPAAAAAEAAPIDDLAARVERARRELMLAAEGRGEDLDDEDGDLKGGKVATRGLVDDEDLGVDEYDEDEAEGVAPAEPVEAAAEPVEHEAAGDDEEPHDSIEADLPEAGDDLELDLEAEVDEEPEDI